MREQLRLLEELQRFDARLQDYDAARKSLPEKIRSLENDLSRMEALLEKERQGLAETERFRQDQDTQLKSDEANILKAKAKLSQVKNGKDYMAAQREIEGTRRLVGDRETEILKLIEVIEQAKKNVEAHEADVAALREHVAKEREAADARLREVEAKSATEKAERDAIAAQVKPDVLKRYASIRVKRGLAVAPVVDGTCQGCHMSIPPQLYNTLQRANTLEACPYCHRLVYWDELMKDKQLEADEASDPKPDETGDAPGGETAA